MWSSLESIRDNGGNYSFPRITITKYNKLDDLKLQKFILYIFGDEISEIKVSARLCSL